jgi:hypothetical protein
MEDVAMPEIRTINGMPNIPECSTIVSLKVLEVIPITNFCMAVKLINNTKSKSMGIKSLSGFCDLKISDKAGYITIISIDEGSYRFHVNSRVKVIMLIVLIKHLIKIKASMKQLKK